ncbi:hypothetical protein IMZ48_20395 [Candidatus Bathyarchaeota archaeon]|nr:hypothetical protein [Candidatus Bathyarchaeota archaeon]
MRDITDAEVQVEIIQSQQSSAIVKIRCPTSTTTTRGQRSASVSTRSPEEIHELQGRCSGDMRLWSRIKISKMTADKQRARDPV